MTRTKPGLKLERDSAFGYAVSFDGREIGYVGGRGRQWHARTVDFDLGEFRSRAAAIEALMDIDRT